MSSLASWRPTSSKTSSNTTRERQSSVWRLSAPPTPSSAEHCRMHISGLFQDLCSTESRWLLGCHCIDPRSRKYPGSCRPTSELECVTTGLRRACEWAGMSPEVGEAGILIGKWVAEAGEGRPAGSLLFGADGRMVYVQEFAERR